MDGIMVGDRVICPDDKTGIVTDYDDVLGTLQLLVPPSEVRNVAGGLVRRANDPGDFFLMCADRRRVLVAWDGSRALLVPLFGSEVTLSRDDVVEIEKRTRRAMVLRIFGDSHLLTEACRIGFKDAKISSNSSGMRFDGTWGGRQVVIEVPIGPFMSKEDAMSLMWHRIHQGQRQPPLDTLGEWLVVLELKDAQQRIQNAENAIGEANKVLDAWRVKPGTLAERIGAMATLTGSLPVFAFIKEASEADKALDLAGYPSGTMAEKVKNLVAERDANREELAEVKDAIQEAFVLSLPDLSEAKSKDVTYANRVRRITASLNEGWLEAECRNKELDEVKKALDAGLVDTSVVDAEQHLKDASLVERIQSLVEDRGAGWRLSNERGEEIASLKLEIAKLSAFEFECPTPEKPCGACLACLSRARKASEEKSADAVALAVEAGPQAAEGFPWRLMPPEFPPGVEEAWEQRTRALKAEHRVDHLERLLKDWAAARCNEDDIMSDDAVLAAEDALFKAIENKGSAAAKTFAKQAQVRRTGKWIVRCTCARAVHVPLAAFFGERRQCKCGLVWEYCGDSNWLDVGHQDGFGAVAPEPPTSAPQSVVANGGCVRLPPFVLEQIGVKDGDGVVFHLGEKGVALIVSNDTAVEQVGWAGPFHREDLIEFDTPDTPDDRPMQGVVTGCADEPNVIHVRVHPDGSMASVNFEAMAVRKLSRCPYVSQGRQCTRPIGHSGYHVAWLEEVGKSRTWMPDSVTEQQAKSLWATVYAKFLGLAADGQVARFVPTKDDPAREALGWANEAVSEFMKTCQ